MKMFREYSQGQIFLLPPSLDEFVPENHEARIINDVVDTMDLLPLLARYEGGGAPDYHPAMMLKLVICAYSRGIYSSRSIARELKTDTAFMFLSGMQSPDFRTICLFRAEHADVLPDLYVEVVRLCASLGMIGLGHIAFDGTKLKANASVRQTRDRDGLEKEIELPSSLLSLSLIDGLAGFGEGAKGVFGNCGAQCEEDREESAPGHTHFT